MDRFNIESLATTIW